MIMRYPAPFQEPLTLGENFKILYGTRTVPFGNIGSGIIPEYGPLITSIMDVLEELGKLEYGAIGKWSG